MQMLNAAAVSPIQPKPLKLDIPFHSKSLYSVEKTIVGISQYAYFSTTFNILLSKIPELSTVKCYFSCLRSPARAWQLHRNFVTKVHGVMTHVFQPKLFLSCFSPFLFKIRAVLF
jgi:hypothetical protein